MNQSLILCSFTNSVYLLDYCCKFRTSARFPLKRVLEALLMEEVRLRIPPPVLVDKASALEYPELMSSVERTCCGL